MSKIGEWLDDRLYRNSHNLPDIKELIDVISKYYRCVPNYGSTYKDMSPDELWEHLYNLLGLPYMDVMNAEREFDNMCIKMNSSTYAHEFMKNEMKKK